MVRDWILLIWLGCISVFVARDAEAQALPDSPSPSLQNAGGQLARVHCAMCHLFPEPRLLDRKTWREQTLPRMKIRLGLEPEKLNRQKFAEILKTTPGFLKQPLLTPDQFEAITQFYLTTAPEQMPPQAPHAPIEADLDMFRFEPSSDRSGDPATTMVRVVPSERRIYVGDLNRKALIALNASGSNEWTLPVENIPVDLLVRTNGSLLTMIGSFMPTEERSGAVLRLTNSGSRLLPDRVLLRDLARPTQTIPADFNGDGREDLLVCQYGNNIGHLAWFEGRADGAWVEHLLVKKTGALCAEIRDLNQDGNPDIVALFAQESESLYLLHGDGKGGFRDRVGLQRPPSYGHTHFEMADIDGDGRLDYLVTNGDNGEYPSPFKPYHGISIYLDRGGRYERGFFYPLNGAFKAIARDFDGDGDLDIAAISFYPDFQGSPREGFVYLENLGGMKFRPRTFPQVSAGRWIVMDAGDVDGDGDIDLVLGSFIHGPTDVPDAMMLDWQQKGPAVVILRNQLQERRAKP